MSLPDPTFPPLLTGHAVKGQASPFEEACARAAAGALGAGDVVWSRNASRLDMAIVLEPDVPLERAVQMMPLAMVAAGDCIGALTPPQVGVTFGWPDKINVNGAAAGLVRAGVDGGAALDEIPRWLVIGIRLRLRREAGEGEPGDTPDVTWLAEEGGGELTRTDLIESYSRHLLTWINTWQDDGFHAVHDSWMFRAADRDSETTVVAAEGQIIGTFLGLDDNGNLLLKLGDGTARAMALADRFERHDGAPAAS